jgi:hypothetical protein
LIAQGIRQNIGRILVFLCGLLHWTRECISQWNGCGVYQDKDDYALVRVSPTARYSWWSMAIQRFGQTSSLAQLIVGAALGFGVSFWKAFLAYILGSVIVEFSVIRVGIIGMREGLTASVLSRWPGFGRSGSAVIGLFAGISLTGWLDGDGTLMPDLVDCHVHLAMDAGPHAVGADLAVSDAAMTCRMVDSAWRLLNAVVTTTRDLGCRDEIASTGRDAVRNRLVPGPRRQVANAPITVTGGHAWPLGGEADGVLEVVRQVRIRGRQRSDAVKIMATGAFMTSPPGHGEWR